MSPPSQPPPAPKTNGNDVHYKFNGLKPIPETYNGVKFKSKLEAAWAKWLDEQGFIWAYEPFGFNIDGTWYLPDFWLPEVNTIIEVKGALQGLDKTFKLYKKIKESNSDCLLLLGGAPVPALYNIEGELDRYYLGRCSKCGKTWICTSYGSYHCRACGNHEGDHDLIGMWEEPELSPPGSFGRHVVYPLLRVPFGWNII
ncbi:MAG: hypothetical protein JRD89_01310 [Deltaproteobacteria bacterium]|nr:hypothetical protein [Deltaproteobacteria bacterium]